MKRCAVLTGLFLATAILYAQAWEKLIVPGLTYRMEVDTSIPRIIHALRYSPGSPEVRAIPQLANGRVFEESADKGRAELIKFMEKELAIAGINGDFFPFTGDPLGAMVRNGELISSPYPNRPVFAWGKGGATTSLVKWKGTIRSDSGVELTLDGINQECGSNDLILNTSSAGLALAKSPCIYAVLEFVEPAWTPNSENVGLFRLFYSDVDSLPIQPGNVVLAARGKAMSALTKLKQGVGVTIKLETTGLDWKKYDQVIGGGPYLVKNSAIFVDWQQQGFQTSFAEKRHPRTAVGKSKDGDVWLVTVDGRQAMSDGATLIELAGIMQKLGCTDAINLDGGGSTTLGLFGRVQNRPSDGTQRKIANAILFLTGPQPTAEGDFAIKGPAEVTVDSAVYKVIGPDGLEVPNAEVFWAAGGSAWIDQGGVLRTNATGSATITVFVRGRRLDLPVRTSKVPSKASTK